MVEPTIRLYVHIPFCRTKCPYCHFYSIVGDESLKDRYLHALLTEIQSRRPWIEGKQVLSLYFGGGTPCLLGPHRIEAIYREITSISDCLGAETTIESNPETTLYEHLRTYLSLGINRLSLGAQTFDPALCTRLCRGHSVDDTVSAVQAARSAGFSNISLDLMYDLPGQTLSTWQATVTTACALPITHISLYNLTIEPNSAWDRRRSALEREMPSSETSLAMYRSAIEILADHGFEQYEISAFARGREGAYQSRHNVGYWTGDDFLGLGPSAFSFLGGRRFANVAHIETYCQAMEEGKEAVDFQDDLAPSNRLNELLAVGLRMNRGVDLAPLRARYGNESPDLARTLDFLESLGLLERAGARIRLSERGRYVYDSIAVELI